MRTVRPRILAAREDVSFEEGSVTWIDPPGTFLERLEFYNEDLGQLRQKLLENITQPWHGLGDNVTAQTIKLIDATLTESVYQTEGTRFFTLALRRRNTTADGIPYSCREDTSNLLVRDSYIMSSTPPFCDYVRRNTKGSLLFSLHKCNEDLTKAVDAQCLEPIDFYSKLLIIHVRKSNSIYPEHYFHHFPEYIFFIHAFYDGIVNPYGYIFTGSSTLMDVVCKRRRVSLRDPPEGVDEAPLVPELFVITQYFGQAHYHKNAETIPRIAPYLQFLKANDQIQIHVMETGVNSSTARTLAMMGIHHSRLVKGLVRAKLVYLPQASNCGFPPAHLLQLTSHVYREYLDKTYGPTEHNSIVMIHRNFNRLLTDYQEKEDGIRNLATLYNLTFEVFSDDPLPSFEEQARIFHRAKVIVGSHGAGLVNMIYSKPGTVVLEGSGSPPRMVMCFPRLARVLGHRHHSIPSAAPWAGSVNISTESFVSTAAQIIDLHFNAV